MWPNFINPPISTLKIEPPKNRNPLQHGIQWLEDKHRTDGAEGLWRIHDSIYDFTNFIKKHPGGSEWLELTEGTDITEAFEAHHLTALPEEILGNYFVRKAATKRNSPFTFKEDGFYKTLKREVVEVLKTLPKQPVRRSALITDFFLIGTFLFAILATVFWNYILAIISGVFLGCVTIAAHNYLHQKDNFRMYYFNLSLMQTREWRISHVLSHHLHTNTVDDMEVAMVELAMQLLPVEKSPIVKYSYLLSFPIYWIGCFHSFLLRRLFYIAQGHLYVIQWYDFIPFTLPLTMYLLGGQSLLATLWMWTFIIGSGSFYFLGISINGSHHHPDIFHDGDTPRSDTDYDWGLNQLDTAMDRVEITGTHLLVLITFGDHTLHHLFPSVDHGLLDLLYPTLKKVCKDFNVDFRMTSQWELIKGTFLQVMKTKPNPNPPDLLKKY